MSQDTTTTLCFWVAGSSCPPPSLYPLMTTLFLPTPSPFPGSLSNYEFFFLLGLWLNSQIFVFLSLSLCPCFSSSFGCSFFFTFLLYCNKIINYSALFLVCCLFDGVYRRSVTSGTKDLLQVICKCSPTATRRMLLASFFLFLGYHPPSRYLSGRHHQLSLLILALILFSYNPIHFCSKTKTNYCIYLLKKLFLVKRLGN
jgi:hypothetical protein